MFSSGEHSNCLCILYCEAVETVTKKLIQDSFQFLFVSNSFEAFTELMLSVPISFCLEGLKSIQLKH